MPVEKSRSFAFTLYKFDTKLLADLKVHPEVKYLIYQSELTPTTNISHLQGYIVINKSSSMTACKKIIGENSVHLEYSLMENKIYNTYYCSKRESYDELLGLRYMSDIAQCGDPTFVWGRFLNKEEVDVYVKSRSEKVRQTNQGRRRDLESLKEYVKDYQSYVQALYNAPTSMQLIMNRYKQFTIDYMSALPRDKMIWPYVSFRPWQQAILELIETVPDDRTINFIVDRQGNTGKSVFTNYLYRNHKAFLCQGALANIAKQYNFETLIICDSPRKVNDLINYSALELLKNGIIISTKYELETKARRSGVNAHIFVFMNQYPDLTALSIDRYHIYTIENYELHREEIVMDEEKVNPNYMYS